MLNLPVSSYKYFWDVDPQTLNINRHKTYIIERLLELGDLDSLKWVNQNYSKKDVQETIKHSRRLSAKTCIFFSLYYNVPREQMLCMTTPSIPKPSKS